MEIINYPDGQVNVQINEIDSIIKMRINSYKDLFILKSLKEIQDYINHLKYRELFIPCLFGQRSDRRFSENESFGLKIICDFINSMNFNRVKIFDPHSEVCMGMINNSKKISSFEYVKKSVYDITQGDPKRFVLCSPDAGAYKKVFKYGEDLNLPVIAANKFRDLSGNVTLNISSKDTLEQKEVLIVDDMLDGGYTFHLLAKQLKEQGANKVYLYISHAYFNKGIDFSEYIDHFYCTNSVKDIEDPKVTQFKII